MIQNITHQTIKLHSSGTGVHVSTKREKKQIENNILKGYVFTDTFNKPREILDRLKNCILKTMFFFSKRGSSDLSVDKI